MDEFDFSKLDALSFDEGCALLRQTSLSDPEIIRRPEFLAWCMRFRKQLKKLGRRQAKKLRATLWQNTP